MLRRAGFKPLRMEGEWAPLELTGSLYYLFGGTPGRFVSWAMERRNRPAWVRAATALAVLPLVLPIVLPWLALESALLCLLARMKRAGNITVYSLKPAGGGQAALG